MDYWQLAKEHVQDVARQWQSERISALCQQAVRAAESRDLSAFIAACMHMQAALPHPDMSLAAAIYAAARAA